MLNSKTARRWCSIILCLSMLFSLLPWDVPEVEAASDPCGTVDVPVYVGVARIENISCSADNVFPNFLNNLSGFQTLGRTQASVGGGDLLTSGDDGAFYSFEIRVKDNPALRALAESGHAKAFVGWNKLAYNEFDCVLAWCKTRVTSASITIDDKELSGSSHGGDTFYRDMTETITPETVITVKVGIEGQGAGAYGVFVKFSDKVAPVLQDYTFNGSGVSEVNEKIGQRELYAKKDEFISIAYNFSEPVRPTSVSSAFSDLFLKHKLFVNPAGTGLPAAGEQQYLTNTNYTAANFSQSYDKVPLSPSIEYKYTATKYHHSGNLPLEPVIPRTKAEEAANSDTYEMDSSLEQKLIGARLADAAGNVVRDFSAFSKVSQATTVGEKHLKAGTNVDPFNYKEGGFRVIVDAVRPKYTKVGNGIQPEILTGVTLNRNDGFDFTVQLTEEAKVKTGWKADQTYLLLNNGMRAKYVSGDKTDKWTFKLKIPDGVDIEAPLLKVIALTHENQVIDPATNQNKDTNVLQDYAGNMLIQPANYDDIFTDPEDGEDASKVNSKIDWAQLSIDNTNPEVSYRYEAGGATDKIYQKSGKVTIDANDPPLIVPPLDPNQPGEIRPSRGIYRPSNMTGSSAPAVGLVYYMWSQSPNDPFAGKEADHFAALKRYSLKAKQPGEDLYTEGLQKDIKLNVANNKTNLIAVPSEALAEEKSGEWYLHTWTADMTWDSARELMQYQKKQKYVESHPEQYEAWKAEAPGSEADKIFYADNKALAQVGDYGNLEVWPLDDFKQDDSNWVHSVGTIKIDNKAPTVAVEEISGDNTAAVQMKLSITDEHSGVDSSFYQWVKESNSIEEAAWMPLAGNQAIVTTQNEVVEDGEYVLKVKTRDKAGNERMFDSQKITVNSSDQISGRFEPDSNMEVYVKSHDVQFKLMGLNSQGPLSLMSVTSATYPGTVTQTTYTRTVTQTTYSGTVTQSTYQGKALLSVNNLIYATYAGYAVTSSQLRPGEASFKAFASYNNGSNGERIYTVPADTSLNGKPYIHILIKVNDGGFEKTYYFSKQYAFDNEPPTVTFSKTGVSYPQDKQSVTATVNDRMSNIGLQKKYQWIDDQLPAPNEASPGWSDLPEGGQVEISNAVLQPGEQKSFRLYVWATDGANNSVIAKTSGVFVVSKSEGADKPPADVTSDLIYLYGDEEDGYTAIVKLGLAEESVDKGGYDFSVSPDNGANWLRWRPYTNFVALKVPTNKTSDLHIQVKYRTPTGVVGEPKSLDAGSISKQMPVYALATLSTERPVNVQTGVDIDIAAPLGIKVVPSAVNPSTPVRTGNTFHVSQNGLYSFDLTDNADASRKATLYAVVKNVDTIEPKGTVEYLTTTQTNGNVTVQLTGLSEPVTVTAPEGRSTYTFNENGTFAFKFKDEAGNEGEAVATVSNIDKSTPKVRVVSSYAYGENGSKTFGTIVDDNGKVLYSNGVTLTVEKDDNDKNKQIFYVDGKDSVMLLDNGTASFTVSDQYGNTTVVKGEVNNIISTAPTPAAITYTFVDEDGNALPDSKIVTINGQPYAKGKMKVTLTGQQEHKVNKVFAGTTPIQVNGQYTNQISDADGSYSYSRTFSADGSTLVALTDLLGNTRKVPVTIKGLDNTPPEIKLNMSSVGITQNKQDFDVTRDLGGYTVSDNVSATQDIKVTISGLDLSKLGRQRVTYTAEDQVGNTSVAYQDVTVVSSDGMLIFADDVLISASSGESALFDKNTLTFNISKYNIMEVNGQQQVNEWGTYDLMYQPGLYREGQMKYIASKISYSDLVNGKFKVTFPETGWYTIIVRNQEREREYSTFFIGKKD
ncbi:Ig-like domain repeat protein [Paenibacillus sp. 32352]|uniref:Ig-like domain repeat protein n=1 Tax=Paenibacillus sp. 32352 TaxID=1969111 RepID=UPI0009AD5CC7|nr:Ig-like domain repeat protein [Paenibacillus sp. 32352]